MRHTLASQRAAGMRTGRTVLTHFTAALSCVSPCGSQRLLSGFLRRGLHSGHPIITTTTHAAASALCCSRATVKSRSLAPDDPFGEKSSWEDPSDGLYSAWKDVDLEGFVNATESAEVRNAHFGPGWARFTTVGRLSVKKMKEDQPVQPPPDSDGAAVLNKEGAAHAAAAASTEAAPAAPARQYPTADELHARELQAKRRLLERNYMSYEAFVEHELGAGEGFSEEVSASASSSTAAAPAAAVDGASELYSAATMEGAFSAVEGLDRHDRMAQRNIEREALDTMEAAEVEEVVPLPNFIHETDTRAAAGDDVAAGASSISTADGFVDAGAVAALAAAVAAPPLPSEELEEREKMKTGIPTPTPITRSGTAAATATADATSIPPAVVHQVLRALGSPHGDTRIPLTDPLHWGTEEVIHFITIMEQRPADVEADAPRETWTTMDDTMTDAFRMAKTTGDTLLNVVVPPRLFRLLRRWHVRRQDVVNKAWRQHQETQAVSAPATAAAAAGESMVVVAEEVVAAAVAQNRGKLEEAVQALDRTLIQETILLCFPYAR